MKDTVLKFKQAMIGLITGAIFMHFISINTGIKAAYNYPKENKILDSVQSTYIKENQNNIKFCVTKNEMVSADNIILIEVSDLKNGIIRDRESFALYKEENTKVLYRILGHVERLDLKVKLNSTEDMTLNK